MLLDDLVDILLGCLLFVGIIGLLAKYFPIVPLPVLPLLLQLLLNKIVHLLLISLLGGLLVPVPLLLLSLPPLLFLPGLLSLPPGLGLLLLLELLQRLTGLLFDVGHVLTDGHLLGVFLLFLVLFAALVLVLLSLLARLLFLLFEGLDHGVVDFVSIQ